MNEMPEFEKQGESAEIHPSELDLHQVEHTPQVASWLRMRASQWLGNAQKAYNEAVFARDGSDASLDRFADARSELDSAEAWALRVADFLMRPQ
ncbi:FruA-associating protein, FapA [Corallococcus sp. BB11-1]|uniref:FruA-associating protein, FapA n=1 Tax=Corallococcus sp. BB11-1 TaxID=2996783 RepID=UPI0022703C08|nr:FruA-associating protein, FapA [Corallococcus sp. BB11-1]MCY1034949.1 FruA-associating protein, FapA [Corallococcus sp. BB11-1]